MKAFMPGDTIRSRRAGRLAQRHPVCPEATSAGASFEFGCGNSIKSQKPDGACCPTCSDGPSAGLTKGVTA